MTQETDPLSAKPNWHTMSVEETTRKLGADPVRGLTYHEAERRLREHGPNDLVEKKGPGPVALFFGQFKDFMILVLIGAAVVSGIVGEAKDTIAIIVIVVLNAVIGFVQEYRAERAMEALKGLAAPAAPVVREGARALIPTSDVAPGDLVILEAGQLVPADLRLVEAAKLMVSEAVLTGESSTVTKSVAPVADPDASLGDRSCMVFRGTTISYGRGLGVAVATGMATEVGKIASLLSGEPETRTPLQRRLAVFGKWLSIGALSICAVVFVAGLLRGEPVTLMFLTAVSLAVAAIPEALPAVVTIALAMGASRMVAKKALIRKLPAVETLGSITFICSDKTGTLTQNKMTVTEMSVGTRARPVDPDNPVGATGALMAAMALNNDCSVDKGGCLAGDPTEAAVFDAARAAGFDKRAVESAWRRVAEVPFDSDRKLMSTVHEDPCGGFVMYTKGALESVVSSSVYALTDTGVEEVDKDALREAGERAASGGLRVLAYAMKRFDTLPSEVGPDDEVGLTFIGFVGMVDPPRPEAAQAVASCKHAGIHPVMITGDHPATALRIARDLGIYVEGKESMTGRELDAMPLHEFERKVEDVSVYARISPEQKLKIVQALKDKGQYVAMTGDGVNDAPALKRADIGVAMGVTGTDVAKEASDMALLDDNFATIVTAVKEGRRIYDNIRKFIKYCMASNSGEIWVLFLAPFLGLPMPLLPIHLLWINLVTDGLPGLSLTVEPAERDVMSRPPRPPDKSVFAHGLGAHIIWVGLLMAGVCIALQAWAIRTGKGDWQSMVFTALTLSQMGHVLAVRSERESLFRQGLFSNMPLLLSVALTVALQMMTLYVPALNPIFRTQPLTGPELLLTLAASSVVFFAVEVEKAFKRRAAVKTARV